VIEPQVNNVGAKLEDELAPVSVLESVEEKADVVDTETVVEEIAPVAISETVEEHILVEYEQSDFSDLVKSRKLLHTTRMLHCLRKLVLVRTTTPWCWIVPTHWHMWR
jgi:hypothetical protein